MQLRLLFRHTVQDKRRWSWRWRWWQSEKYACLQTKFPFYRTTTAAVWKFSCLSYLFACWHLWNPLTRLGLLHNNVLHNNHIKPDTVTVAAAATNRWKMIIGYALWKPYRVLSRVSLSSKSTPGTQILLGWMSSWIFSHKPNKPLFLFLHLRL